MTINELEAIKTQLYQGVALVKLLLNELNADTECPIISAYELDQLSRDSGLSRTQFAKQLGITYRHLCRLCEGKAIITKTIARKAQKIAAQA